MTEEREKERERERKRRRGREKDATRVAPPTPPRGSKGGGELGEGSDLNQDSQDT